MYDLSMKISKITNKSFLAVSSVLLPALLFSCGSSKVEPAAPVVVEEPVVQEVTPPPAPEVEPEEVLPVEEPLPVAPEPSPVVEEPEPEPEPEPDIDDEYSRSVGTVSVSRDTFAEDKDAVLRVISALAEIMTDSSSNKSYNAWLGYVDPNSRDYWKLRKNLQKAEKKLPVKGIKLQTLQDYFKHVFCPARRGREVTEIRYISDNYIKAVQVQKADKEKNKEEQVTVYYYFNKINGEWMVHLPTNEEFN